jgi:dipeptidase E
MKLLLTPEGIRNQAIADALAELLGKPISESNILFIPTPANLRTDDKSWIVENMNQFLKLNPRSFDIADIAGMPTEQVAEHFEAADVICIGGGDDSYISEVLRTQGLVEPLRDALQSRIFMGISAGSMLVGTPLPPNVNKKFYPDEPFLREQAQTLGWCDITFIPHLGSKECPEVRVESLELLKESLPINTVAVADESAIVINGDDLNIVGEGESWKHQ